MNAWSPSSPSSVLSEGWHIISTLPRQLWDGYVTYLLFYQPNSWVGRIASTFRILAFVLVLPVVVLTLLDVTSYVIARTLGIVDDVKASTSDADPSTTAATTTVTTTTATATAAATTNSNSNSNISNTNTNSDGNTSALLGNVGAVAVPRVPLHNVAFGIGLDIGSPVRTSEGLASEDTVRTQAHDEDDGYGCVSGTAVGTTRAHASHLRQSHIQREGGACVGMEVGMGMGMGGEDGSGGVPRAYYFAGEEDLRLAGEGVFSPAVSMPPSPVIPRMPSHAFTESDGGSSQASEVEGVVLRKRVRGVPEDELDPA